MELDLDEYNSFYQHSKILQLWVMRGGEESHEDSLKITNDENYLEAWICILMRYEPGSRSSCDSALKKYLNSQTWQNGLNNQNHARAMKIRPKTEKMNLTSYERILLLDHEETSPIQFGYVFHDIWSKLVFTIHDEKLVSWGSMNEKFRSWVEECFCVLEWCEKIKFSYFDKFSHFTNFDEMKNIENLHKILSTLENLKQIVTLTLSSCSPKLKMRKWGSWGRKWGVI